MSKHPKISIITPVYNGENYIEKCLRSVLDQKCQSAAHIIIDGGSTDRTPEIIREFADEHRHVRWISEEDKGQTDALNKGIRLAQSEIIGILNVDDYYEPNVLQRVLRFFEKLPDPSFLVGNCNVWDHKGKLQYVNKPRRLKISDLLLGGILPHPVNPAAYFYHKSIHDRIGKYNAAAAAAHDLDFILSAVQAANVKYVDETWGNWCKFDGTITVTNETNGNAGSVYWNVVDKHIRSLSQKNKRRLLAKKKYYKIKNNIRKLILR